MENFIYWKVQFDSGLEGFGYLKLTSDLYQVGLFTEKGDLVTEGVSYHPIEFDCPKPEWDA